MTNCLFKKYWYLTVAVVLFFASASFAQTTESITLTGTGDNAVAGNVYVDPYTASINAGASDPYVICDDWSDNTYVGESWTANVTTTATITSGSPPMFTPTLSNSISSSFNVTGTPPTTLQALYNELAYMANQLMSNSATPALQAEWSFAMWELTWQFTPTSKAESQPFAYLSSLSGTMPGANGTTYTYAQILTAAESDLSGAETNESGYTGSNWEVLTPSGAGTCGGTSCGTPQEFLMTTTGNGNGSNGLNNAPESSATLVFGADMLGLLGLAFIFRRRLLRTIQ